MGAAARHFRRQMAAGQERSNVVCAVFLGDGEEWRVATADWGGDVHLGDEAGGAAAARNRGKARVLMGEGEIELGFWEIEFGAVWPPPHFGRRTCEWFSGLRLADLAVAAVIEQAVAEEVEEEPAARRESGWERRERARRERRERGEGGERDARDRESETRVRRGESRESETRRGERAERVRRGEAERRGGGRENGKAVVILPHRIQIIVRRRQQSLGGGGGGGGGGESGLKEYYASENEAQQQKKGINKEIMMRRGWMERSAAAGIVTRYGHDDDYDNSNHLIINNSSRSTGESECFVITRPKGGRRSLCMDLEEVKACRDLGLELDRISLMSMSPTNSTIDYYTSCSGGNSPIASLGRISSSPGDDPRDVKARLKTWAQMVALATATR
ncbi:hypothetical protein Syun_008235 [Stephania yunnanensis]|uniref:Uncharacterized protein n=1 Tax=Stephania yunnanensis TaxID=152371 RepID=A0AAP0L3T2_9MAGN